MVRGNRLDFWPILLFVVCAYGWIANVVKFFYHVPDVLTILEVLRGDGIIVFPVGIVLGFF
jgi:hypothetical protein